uniref:PDGFA_0 protein n=1 Tax=Fopius arisanus TaxID=64838 RepID=A0A0C9Q9W1_9HYME
MKLWVLAAAFSLAVGQRNTYYGDPGAVMFPGPINTNNPNFKGRAREDDSDNEQTSISLSLSVAKQINELDSVDDFLNMLEGVPDNEKISGMTNRFGGEERTNAIRPKPAKCIPELQPVPFKTDDTSVTYYPSCTRIKRCGGCCGHALLSCQPTESEVRNFEVIKSTIGGNGKPKYSGKEIILLEEHKSCDCQCTIKPEDCTQKQKYEIQNCRCICQNGDEETKCRKSNDTKLWDPDACNCLCRNIEECNTGYYFDQSTCRCDDGKMIFL